MRFPLKGLALCAALVLVGAAAPSAEVAQVLDSASARNPALKAYTFDLHVNVWVHTFPALRFHLDGVGTYERPKPVRIRFTHVPWFGKGFENVDLGALEPNMWPQSYDVSVTRHEGEVTELALHDLKKSPLKQASARVDAKTGLQQMVWEYDYGGRVQLDVKHGNVEGYQLPTSEDADIVMPHIKATAHAEFTNFHVVTDTADAPAP
jgi:hypothetical protein